MNSKTEDLLRQAARQKHSETPERSSVACAERRFASNVEAEKFFEQSKEKLLLIERWNNKSALNHYKLFDRNGEPNKVKQAQIGDFVQISLRGALKNDWVEVVSLENSLDESVLTVCPANDPTAENNDENVTSHFFTSEATNNFCLQRENETIKFYVVGLNEKSNTAESGGLLESIRNLGVANIGSYFGIQKAEWKTFCENFLEIEGDE